MTVEYDRQELGYEDDPIMEHVVRYTGIPVTEVRVLARLEED